MLIGLSHIALNCVNIRRASERLARYGYENIFGEKQLYNHRLKMNMMANYVATHHIEYFISKGNMSIELISYGSLSGFQSPNMIPLMVKGDPCQEWQKVKIEDVPVAGSGMKLVAELFGVVPIMVYDPVLMLNFLWIKDYKKPPGFAACILPTSSLEKTRDVLSALRFSETRTGLWSILTPLSSLQATLIPVQYRDCGKWSYDPMLDSPGATCLALMASNTWQMQIPAQCEEHYAKFDLVVNNKNCHIIMAKPRHFPYVEFIQFTNDY